MTGGEAKRRTIAIHCAACRALLYRYKKGGTGGLVKCFVERIVEDRTAGDLRCPECSREFARPIVISGRPAHKIIQARCSPVACGESEPGSPPVV